VSNPKWDENFKLLQSAFKHWPGIEYMHTPQES